MGSLEQQNSKLVGNEEPRGGFPDEKGKEQGMLWRPSTEE